MSNYYCTESHLVNPSRMNTRQLEGSTLIDKGSGLHPSKVNNKKTQKDGRETRKEDHEDNEHTTT